MTDKAGRLPVILCYIQGVYFAATGLWPIFHIDSFIVVTGPKTDLWLVKTVGVQVTAVAAALLIAAKTRNTGKAIKVLAAGGAAGFMIIDTYYAYYKDRISNIYLADALMQLLFILAWITVIVAGNKKDKGKSYV